jgi:uncharacterized membrane protein
MLSGKLNTLWEAAVTRVWVPVLFVLLAIPLILGIVPRNYFYGFRSRRTLESDAVWYPANRMSGVLLALAGLAWGTSGSTVGLMSLGVAILVSAVYTGWLVARQG